MDAEFAANLVVKEALLEEARALLPINDLAAAKAKLDSIRGRWEDAGKVPRGTCSASSRRCARWRTP